LRANLLLLFLALLLLAVVIISVGLGPVSIPPGRVLEVISANLLPPYQPLAGPDHAIVWNFRLARALLVVVVGASLGMAGAAFQGLFRNPLADPFVIGASSGAALGATLAIYFGSRLAFGGMGPVALAAFVGALGTVALVYLIAGQNGLAPAVTLLLTGTALSSFFSAGVSFLMTLNQETLNVTFFWLLGGFAGRSWPQLQAVWPYMLVGWLLLLLLSRPLDLLGFGEETAQGMGLNVGQARLLIVGGGALLTASAVASSGIIGFVGLVAPHTARLIFGPIHQRLLPASAVMGAFLLILADNAARLLLAPIEIPIGVLTALLGAPFFLYLLHMRRQALLE
jgi:iron complex transport system permease protein